MSSDTGLFWCPQCQATTQLVIKGTVAHSTEDGPASWYRFGHCIRCDQVGIARQVETGPNQWDREWGPQLYPPVSRPVDFQLPSLVDESFREALKCEAAEAPLATAVMVRRTLEAIAKEFDPGARTLFKGLDAMRKKGAISDELAQWGDELRFIGNIGAHPNPDDRITMEDAREAVEFLKAIAENIYHLRPKFQAMQARRQRKTKVAQPVNMKGEQNDVQPTAPKDDADEQSD